jgi:hypothetical protein
MKDKDIVHEGDALLFDEDKTNSKKNLKDNKSGKNNSDDLNLSENEKNILNKRTARNISSKNNDEIIIRIKRPNKLFLERCIWSFIVLFLLFFVIKGSSCEISQSLLDKNIESVVGNGQANINLSNETELNYTTDELEEDEIIENIETEDIQEEVVTCKASDLDISVNKIDYKDSQLKSISIKIKSGNTDLVSYGLALAVKIQGDYIGSLNTSSSDGVRYYPALKVNKCSEKIVTITDFSPTRYGTSTSIDFRVRLYDSKGKMLDSAIKTYRI